MRNPITKKYRLLISLFAPKYLCKKKDRIIRVHWTMIYAKSQFHSL